MRRVLFIAYYFPPGGGAGAQRPLKFVQDLPSEGFLPVVVTAPALIEDRWAPQDATLMTGIPANVPVCRVEGPAPAPGSKLRRRLERWLWLPSSCSNWWLRSATEAASKAAIGASLIFATMSPFESGEVAAELSQRLGVPWVADLRDPWALDEMTIYATLLHRKFEMAKMQKLLSSAAIIVMNTPEAAASLKAAFPRLRSKDIRTITNGFDAADFANGVVPRTDTKFRIVHTGYLHTEMGFRLRRKPFDRLFGGAERGVDILTRSHAILLEAVERWCEHQPEVRNDLEIVCAGITSDQDRALAANSKIASLIRFTGYLSHSESLRLVRSADLLFLPMHNLLPGRRSRIVPGKTYEYMASGRPILAAVPDGDARDFLRQTGTGLICRPDDTAGMIRILNRVYAAWKSGQSIVAHNIDFVAQFERRKLTRALADAFRTLLAEETHRELSAINRPTF